MNLKDLLESVSFGDFEENARKEDLLKDTEKPEGHSIEKKETEVKVDGKDVAPSVLDAEGKEACEEDKEACEKAGIKEQIKSLVEALSPEEQAQVLAQLATSKEDDAEVSDAKCKKKVEDPMKPQTTSFSWTREGRVEDMKNGWGPTRTQKKNEGN